MRLAFSFRTALWLAAACVFSPSVHAADPEVVEMETAAVKPEDVGKLKPESRQAEAEIAPASSEGELALKRMKLPPDLTATLWAAEPMLANPVAFNFDERGRVFVAETYRYHSSVLDIRDYMWMLEDDLANRTIEDQEAGILRHFGADGVKELSLESERVQLLEDTDHDGKADRSTVFAEGFNSPIDGIGSGVLARRGQVWYTNIPSLWLLDGETKDGVAAKHTELSRGYGVRFNFTGHDLHGLIFGPDGKIYFSVGDRGAHATAIDGSVVDSPDAGSVFRCNPDGTQLEIFATGLRNPQSLLFNEYGDLFTGDNDSDQGDEERLVHIVEGGDSGWRIGYQHAPLGNAGAWNIEKLWLPRFKEQAAYLLAPICNIEDGPSGIAYYPGTGLNETYAGSIFITHFKGSIARSGIYRYVVKPRGASYAIADAKPFLTSALPTDVKFGPDGKLYYSDWAEGWPKSKKGRIYAISDPKHVNDAIVKETQAIMAGDWTKKSPEELAKLLGHADWRVRLEAQYTLAERGAEGLRIFGTVAKNADAPALARRHAIWGLGELSAKELPSALDPLRTLTHDADAEVRAQSIKILGDHRAADQFEVFVAALQDQSNRVKFFAAQSLGKLHRPDAASTLFAALRANNDRDDYVRHALVMGLVGSNNLEALTAAITDESRAARLGAVLALRRLGRPEVARFLADSDPLVADEAARAINDAPIDDALPALAALIAKAPSVQPASAAPVGTTIPSAEAKAKTPENAPAFSAGDMFMLRVLNANFRLGTPANAAALATYASRSDAPAALRGEAIAHLATWPKPPARDRIVGIFRPLTPATRDATIAVNALSPAVPALLAAAAPEAVQTATIAAIETLRITDTVDTLFAVASDKQHPAAARAAALRSLEHFKSPRLAEAVRIASEAESSFLRRTALPIAARLSPDAAAPVLVNLVVHGDVADQKAAFRVLGSLQHPSVDPLLAEQLRLLAEGKIAPAAQLELLEAAAKRTDATVKQLLAEHDAQLAKSGDPLAPFRIALVGGDAKRGATLFYQHPVLACVRCHKAGGDGGDAGPNLASVGATYPREYLLESIVKPNAKIAPGFEIVTLTLKSGAVRAGTVTTQDENTLTLKLANNSIERVAKADIAKREGAPSGMPEIFSQILTKAELRDLVEFLSNQKSKPASYSEPAPRALRAIPASTAP